MRWAFLSAAVAAVLGGLVWLYFWSAEHGPVWLVTDVRYVFAAIPATMMIYVLVRTEWRKHRRRCVNCGVDLRNTPDRCPKCGKGRVRKPVA